MAQRPIVPVILSGGAGQRLWPLSREHHPKQFLNLVSDKSLLQDTARRFTGARFGPPLVVCNDAHRFIIAEQLREIGVAPSAIVLEPAGRNTAPAAALAALVLAENDPDQIMVVTPSDHRVRKPKRLTAAVMSATKAAAEAGRLVTFGIAPDWPATGFGYIKRGEALKGFDGCFAVANFGEKPDVAAAAKYLASGDYLWNSGIFVFTAGRYLEVLEALRPDMVAACRKAIDSGRDDLDFFRPDAAAFAACPSDSIDYAVMEHTDAGAVVPVDIGWDDLGSWTAMWRVAAKDADGNVTVGDVVAEDVRNSYLRSDGPLLAAIGLDDVFVIATDDAVLAVSWDSVERVRALVERMQAVGRTEHLSHPRVYRPWGWYQTLDVGDRFQVKHLMVKAGGRLSLQAHRHRAEHWVVVSGTARVTRGDEIITLGENESVYLAAGVRHRLENTTKNPLRVIEVQSGRYLGEDDIVRFDDDYGRR